jgi:hypothetical protein
MIADLFISDGRLRLFRPHQRPRISIRQALV